MGDKSCTSIMNVPINNTSNPLKPVLPSLKSTIAVPQMTPPNKINGLTIKSFYSSSAPYVRALSTTKANQLIEKCTTDASTSDVAMNQSKPAGADQPEELKKKPCYRPVLKRRVADTVTHGNGELKQRQFFHSSLASRLKAFNTAGVPWKKKTTSLSVPRNEAPKSGGPLKKPRYDGVVKGVGKSIRPSTSSRRVKRYYQPVAVLLPTAKTEIHSLTITTALIKQQHSEQRFVAEDIIQEMDSLKENYVETENTNILTDDRQSSSTAKSRSGAKDHCTTAFEAAEITPSANYIDHDETISVQENVFKLIPNFTEDIAQERVCLKTVCPGTVSSETSRPRIVVSSETVCTRTVCPETVCSNDRVEKEKGEAPQTVPTSPNPSISPLRMPTPYLHGTPAPYLQGTPCTSSKEKSAKKRKMLTGKHQMVLDFGQKPLGTVQCTTCGMTYSKKQADDEAMHDKHHRDLTNKLRFTSWANQRVVQDLVDGSRILLVMPDDKSAMKRVELVKSVVDIDLGFVEGERSSSLSKVFLYVKEKRIVGFCAAQVITEGYRLLAPDSLTVTQPISVSTNGAPTDDQPHNGRDRCDGKTSGRVVQPLCCGMEPEPARCGINRIWVLGSERRKHIACRLLDAARANILMGVHVRRNQIAFSDPTPDGIKLAANYCGTTEFLIYKSTR